MRSSALRLPAWWNSMPGAARRRLPSPGAAWPSRATTMRSVGRPPAPQLRQEPRHAALVAAAAHVVEQVVAVDEQQARRHPLPPSVPSGAPPGGYHRCMLLLVDLDGVVYRGPEPVPGMPELLARREAAGDIIVYVTNNSRWHRSEYLERLVRHGRCRPPRAHPDLGPRHGPGAGPQRRSRPAARMVFGGPGLARELERRRPGDGALHLGGAGRWGRTRSSWASTSSSRHERLSVAAAALRAGGLVRGHQPRPALPRARPPAWPAPAPWSPPSSRRRAVSRTSSSASRSRASCEEAAQARGACPSSRPSSSETACARTSAAARRVGARSILVLTGVSTADDGRGGCPTPSGPPGSWRGPTELGRLLDELEPDRADGRLVSVAARGAPRRCSGSGSGRGGVRGQPGLELGLQARPAGLVVVQEGGRDRPAAWRRRPRSASGPARRTARSSSRTRVRSLTVRSSVLMVTGTPARTSRGRGALGVVAADARLAVARGAQVQRHLRACAARP